MICPLLKKTIEVTLIYPYVVYLTYSGKVGGTHGSGNSSHSTFYMTARNGIMLP